MFEYLFNNKHIETILFFLVKNDYCYAKQLADNFNAPIYGFQKALGKLEKGGLLVSFLEGNVRIYEFNKRYPFVAEIREIFKKAYTFLPDELSGQYIVKKRMRPRRKGKLIR